MPEVARNIAKVLNELRRAAGDFQSHFTGQFNDVNPRKWVEEQLNQPPPQAPAPPETPAVSEPHASDTPEAPPNKQGGEE
jgi:Sec-independent protein translocase protein TatA